MSSNPEAAEPITTAPRDGRWIEVLTISDHIDDTTPSAATWFRMKWWQEGMSWVGSGLAATGAWTDDDGWLLQPNEVSHWRECSEPMSNSETGGWQPIETAPTDKDILIFAPDANHGNTQYVGTRHAGKYGSYFSLSGSDCQTGCGNTGSPTHWMPLPEGPVTNGS